MTKEKDVALQVRLPKEEKDLFVALCKQRDSTASREVRQFIRDYLKKHSQVVCFDRSGRHVKENHGGSREAGNRYFT